MIMTRDNGLALQETWSYGFEEGFEKHTGRKNPYVPSLIYHVNNGMSEIWEADDSFAWFKDQLLELNNKGHEFFDNTIKQYKEIYELMQKYKNKSLNLKELKALVNDIKKICTLFVSMYYTAYDERSPKDIRDKAQTWREKDEFYDIFERVIKDSISNLAPQAKDRELVVTIDDFDSVPSAEVLDQRMKSSIFIPGNKIQCISVNEFLDKHKEYEFIFDEITDEAIKGIIKGNCAMKGYGKGKVRILRRKIEIPEFQKGEILVSPMTTPDFVPAMEKAVAIVTDEGGITSHAAIVSRELNVPCIIGTKIATKVLKDGDIVEVDADKGIVRKL